MITITSVNAHEVVSFARGELLKYLRRMLGPEHVSEMTAAAAVTPESGQTPVLRLGLIADFPELAAPQVEDPVYDDAIVIQVRNGAGIIAGINPRSVLLAVYRFLTEAGCRWIRPGADGEIVPSLTPAGLARLRMELAEKASYRHRGVCIEGALSLENLIDCLDWLPKVGMNAYFIQFREGYTFFARWYTHENNPLKAPAPFSVELAREIVRQAEQAIRQRGLMYHAVGHGWTCEPLGFPGLGWDQRPPAVPPEARQYLAEINGERGLWRGVPLNTNLCYANPEARRIIVDDVIAYIRRNSGVDLLHLWLADGSNNHCECPACREAIPSDFYVRLLNELDAALTREGLSTRIVFLIYVDLLWPPETERLANPGRFVLMFAPITRSYTESFAAPEDGRPLPPYERNRLTFPSSVGENLAFLRAWQRVFPGDSFDFDYHLMWAHYFDPGCWRLARTAHEDIRNLRRIGLNGLISCQVARAYLPTGLPLTVMARTLWNERVDLEEIARDYFAAAFGPDGEKCRAFLASLPILADGLNVWATEPVKGGMLDRIKRIPAMIREFAPTVEANCDLADRSRARSWQYLRLHLRIVERLAMAVAAKAEGNNPEALRRWEELKRFVQEREDEMQGVFDVCLFIFTMERMSRGLMGG